MFVDLECVVRSERFEEGDHSGLALEAHLDFEIGQSLQLLEKLIFEFVQITLLQLLVCLHENFEGLPILLSQGQIVRGWTLY